jgi:hypothetical protein
LREDEFSVTKLCEKPGIGIAAEDEEERWLILRQECGVLRLYVN